MVYAFVMPNGMELARTDSWTVIENAKQLEAFLKEKKLYCFKIRNATKVGFAKKESKSYEKVAPEDFLTELGRRGCYAAIDGHGFAKIFAFKPKGSAAPAVPAKEAKPKPKKK